MIDLEKRRARWRRASIKYRIVHYEKCLKMNQDKRKRYIQERKCVGCSRPLDEGDGKTCVNCGGTTLQEQSTANRQRRAHENINNR